ncbi:MAG: TIGR03619 family F420-dependent LLM class oxidoreductase [Candidatus Binatia bacterium]
MKFALGTPGVLLYPPIMSPWEPGASGADVVRVAQAADDLGWDWLTISEHIVMPKEMAGVMGARFPDSLTAAAVLAGATKRIKLLTYVLVLPYRNPVLLAKQIATLDFLSGGRITFGTGGGHVQREFEVLGVPFAERGKRTDEYILAMKELWTSVEPSFTGQYVQFDHIVFEPKPVQQPHPPILIGGNSKPAMRRAATVGDGWLPWLVTREQLPGCLAYIRAQPGFAQRAGHFEVVMPLVVPNVEDYSHRELGPTRQPGNREELIEQVGLLKEAGATAIQVAPPRTSSVDELADWIAWFAAGVMPGFR